MLNTNDILSQTIDYWLLVVTPHKKLLLVIGLGRSAQSHYSDKSTYTCLKTTPLQAAVHVYKTVSNPLRKQRTLNDIELDAVDNLNVQV